MKKSLLLGITWITLVALTATTLYAQTVTGSSIVDKMKAAARTSFTLSADLNPGQTGFDSAPVSGKKTGNMLTAGEWNRMLELISEGGSGGGSGWVDVSLTGGDNFDDQCMYRFKLSSSALFNYIEVVGTDAIYWYADGTRNIYIAKGAKNTLADSAAASRTVTKIEKLCGGGGSAGGTVQIVEWGIIRTSAKTLSNWDLITLEGSWNSGGGDAAPTGGYIYKLGWQAKLAYVEASGISKDITLSTTAQTVHNLSVRLSGDSVIIDPSSTNTLAYVVWKFGGGSVSSPTPSNLVYINPDNTNFAPLACTPGVNYMINPIGFSAASATAYTSEKVAVLGTGTWQLKWTGFFTNRNRDSNRDQVLRISSVMDGTTTHIYTNSQDQGLYGSRFDVPVSVPTGKTADILVWVQNLSLYGGNIVAWCTN
jgi:hypothetical protein